MALELLWLREGLLADVSEGPLEDSYAQQDARTSPHPRKDRKMAKNKWEVLKESEIG